MYRSGHSQSNRSQGWNKKTKVSNEVSKGTDKSCCKCCSNFEVKQLMFTHKKCQNSLCFWCAVKTYIESLDLFQKKKKSSKLQIRLFEFKVKTPCCFKSETGFICQLQKYFTNNCPIDGVKCKSQKFKYWGGIEIGRQCFEKNYANVKNNKVDEKKKLDIIEQFCYPECNGCKLGTKVPLQLHLFYFIQQKGFCEDCIQTQLKREQMVQIKKQELKPQKKSKNHSKRCVKCQKEQVLKTPTTNQPLKSNSHLAEFEGQSYCHLCLYKNWVHEVSQFHKNQKLKAKQCIQLTFKYQQCFLKNCLTCGRQQIDNRSVFQFKNNRVQIQFWAFVCGACKHYLEFTIGDKTNFIQSFIDYLKHIDQSTQDLKKLKLYFDQHLFLCSQNLKKLQRAKKQVQNSQENHFSQHQQINLKQKAEKVYADQFIQPKQENKQIHQQQLTQNSQSNAKEIIDKKVDGSQHQLGQIQKERQISSLKIQLKKKNSKTELDTNECKSQKRSISTRNSLKKQEKKQQNNENIGQNQIITQKCQNLIINQQESQELKCKNHKVEDKFFQEDTPRQQLQKKAGQLVKNNIQQANNVCSQQNSNLRSQLDLDLELKQQNSHIQGISKKNNSVSRQHQEGLHQFHFSELITDFQKLDQLPPKYEVRLGQKQLAKELRQSLSGIVLTHILKQNESDPQQHCMEDPFNRNLHQPIPLSCQLCKRYEPILLLEKYCSYCFTLYLIGKAKTIGQPI